jgi:hypothetical protein
MPLPKFGNALDVHGKPENKDGLALGKKLKASDPTCEQFTYYQIHLYLGSGLILPRRLKRKGLHCTRPSAHDLVLNNRLR